MENLEANDVALEAADTALEGRVFPLELDQHAPPNQIVAGRSYCVTRTNTNLRDSDTANTGANDLYAQFSTFTFAAEFSENNTVTLTTLGFSAQTNRNETLSSFALEYQNPTGVDYSYEQSGSQLKLDPAGTNSNLNETLSVSADGSLLVGVPLGDFTFGSTGRSLTAGTSVWREYRPDLGDSCDLTLPPGVTPRAF